MLHISDVLAYWQDMLDTAIMIYTLVQNVVSMEIIL